MYLIVYPDLRTVKAKVVLQTEFAKVMSDPKSMIILDITVPETPLRFNKINESLGLFETIEE